MNPSTFKSQDTCLILLTTQRIIIVTFIIPLNAYSYILNMDGSASKSG